MELLPVSFTETVIIPFRLTVPEITSDPLFFRTGSPSPVTVDSSTSEDPSITIPSAGMFSPGLTCIVSPGTIDSIGESTTFSFFSMCTLSGRRDKRVVAEEFAFFLVSDSI